MRQRLAWNTFELRHLRTDDGEVTHRKPCRAAGLIASVMAATLLAGNALIPAARAAPPEHSDAAQPRSFITSHSGVFGSTRLRYKAVVQEHFITDASGKRTASIFTTSYIRTDTNGNNARPVIFAFNGGPGSASLWLHMGFLGPQRVDFDDTAKPATTPPFRTLANPDSPLDVADIVLIDPPGTGFSRVLPDGRPEQFYGVDQDARATIEVMHQWIRTHGRWNAPKYLLSESYGTVRAAALAKLAAGGPMETGGMDGLALNGIIMLGQAMDMSGGDGDLSVAMALPSLAATACHFRKVSGGCTAEGQAEAARRFVSERYLTALYAGSALPPEEREAVGERLSSLVGLPKATILANNLRLSPGVFSRLLLAGEKKQVGLYDARFTLPLSPDGNDPVADDPAMGQYVPGFVAAWNQYARENLAVSLDIHYEPIAFRSVNARWDYGYGAGVLMRRNYAADLAVAMRRNPHLRLLVGTGYYDLVTTLGAAEYTVRHAGIPLEAVVFREYESGHMPYLGAVSRAKLAQDVRAFVQGERP